MTELFFKYKTIISTAALGIIAVVMFILFFKTTDDFEYTTPVEVDNSVHAQVEEEVDTMSLNSIFVEIKGAVKHPNVYEMPKDARVKDIILLGEPLDSADLNQINQSEKLRDEMSIYVPAKGEIIETERETSSSHIVNINKASKDELMTLNGIGAKKAETIINYREENGLFEKKEDLMNIPGIGQKTFENLENDIEI